LTCEHRLRAAPQAFERADEVARRIGAELHSLAGGGVDERQRRRVQREPRHLNWVGSGITIDGIPQHRVTKVGEVNTHLVRAACTQLGFHQRSAGQLLDRSNDRARWAPASPRRQGGPTRAGPRTADAPPDQHLVAELPARQGQVAPLRAVRAKLSLQPACAGVGKREDQHTRGFPVEAVNDQDPVVAAGSPLQLGGGTGDHGISLAFGCRVDQQTRRLVDHDDVRVQVEDFDRGRAVRTHALRQVAIVCDQVFRAHERTWVGDHVAVDQHVAEEHLAFGVSVGRREKFLRRAGQPALALLHGSSVPPPSVVGGHHCGFRSRVKTMRTSGEVAELLARAVRAGLAVGWVALATRRGKAGLCWCAGSSGVGAGDVEPNLSYDLASLTKPLATGTLLLLARRDGLRLETPLADFIPELGGSPWGAVTVIECATHTAGFPAWAPLYAAHGVSRSGYLEALRELVPTAPPGGHVEYSCPGFIALGLALERAGGADLATLFTELVAEPLELGAEIGFAPPSMTSVAGGEREWSVETRLLAERGLDASPPEAPAGVIPCGDGNARGLEGVAGNAGLFGTAAAVATLAAEYLPGGGDLLTAEEAQLATRCYTHGLEQARGIAWQLAASPRCSAGPALPPDAFGHTGFSGTSVWLDPTSGAVLVLLGNRLHPGGRTPDLHPLRRRFHGLAMCAVSGIGDGEP
jgi:CubicO group peptidase (beta-lactamase class C family)